MTSGTRVELHKYDSLGQQRQTEPTMYGLVSEVIKYEVWFQTVTSGSRQHTLT